MVDGESTSTTFANLSGFVSEEHLDVALRNLHNQCTSHGPLDVTVSLTNGGHTLTIRRYLQPTNEVDLGVVDDSRASDDQDEMPTEIDEEAMYMKKAGQRVEIVYEIMHSPSYQVPVLHFYFADPTVGSGQGIEAVYRYVVAPQHHQSLQSLGVLGGIGPVDHPVTGVPCFWVHPCRTAEAMGDILKGMQSCPTLDDYLSIWFGLVGNIVGLSLPTAIFKGRQRSVDCKASLKTSQPTQGIS